MGQDNDVGLAFAVAGFFLQHCVDGNAGAPVEFSARLRKLEAGAAHWECRVEQQGQLIAVLDFVVEVARWRTGSYAPLIDRGKKWLEMTAWAKHGQPLAIFKHDNRASRRANAPLCIAPIGKI